jgi:alpha-L-fucosidase
MMERALLENGIGGISMEIKTCVVKWHTKTYGADFKYEEFATMWKTSMFDPDYWASLFQQAGAKYVVLTSKHHEGFCNWRSAQSWNWNSVDTGPHQDNVALVTNAVRKAGLRMGLYHSLFEWFNPIYLADKANNGTTTVYTDTILQPQLRDIVNSYQPEIVWADGGWDFPDDYWKSKEFLAWLYNDSPVKDTVVVNDRWGAGDSCKHGGYYTCADRFHPGTLQPHKWENCMTIDTASWGYRRNAKISDMLSSSQLIGDLISTVACGGNLLLNVGPTSEGMIVPAFAERLLAIGAWLNVNGPSIYGTTPWRSQNDTAANVWYTQNGTIVYAIATAWPKDNQLILTQPIPSSSTQATMLGFGPLSVSTNEYKSITIQFPDVPLTQLPSEVAWAIELVNVS